MSHKYSLPNVENTENIYLKNHLSVTLLEATPLMSFLHHFDESADWNERISRGEVRVFGKIVGKKYQLKKNDLLEWGIFFPEPEVRQDFSIVYSDPFIVVIDKPAPLPVHPCGLYLKNTLTSLLKLEGHQLFSINRIDKETSGLILFARQPQYVEPFSQALAAGVKFYWVLVHGATQNVFDCRFSLGKKMDSRIHKRMGRTENGKSAYTFFQRIYHWHSTKNTLLIARPFTGRTHQIRTHLVEMGYPIVGDKIYGNDEENFLLYLKEGNTERVMKSCDGLLRHFLHAGSIKILHPWLKKEIMFHSPLAKELQDFLKKKLIL